MMKMKNFFAGVIMACLLSGCGTMTVPFSGEDRAAQEINVVFLEKLLNKNYEGAYEFFSTGMKKALPFEKFQGMMDAFSEKLGRMDDYEIVYMPFLTTTPIETELLGDVSRDDVSSSAYELIYGSTRVPLKITLIAEDGETKIGAFSILWREGEGVPAVRDRFMELGITESLFKS